MDEIRNLKTVTDIESETTQKEIPKDPFLANCEFCDKQVTTYAKEEINIAFWPSLVCIIYFYGIYGFILSFFAYLLMQNIVHYCPSCLSYLYIKKFFPITIKDQFVTLQMGKCVILLRQIYVILLLIIILAFGIYYNISYYMNPTEINSHSHHKPHHYFNKDPSKQVLWEDFLQECGASRIVENSAKVNEIFVQKYLQTVITWKGHYISSYRISPMQLGYNPDHKVNLNIRMIPSESLKAPDLFLSIDEQKVRTYSDIINNLQPGDPIEFSAVLEAVGNEWRSHHLHLISLKKAEEFISKTAKVKLFQGATVSIMGHKHIDKPTITHPISNTTNENINHESKASTETLTTNERKIDNGS